SAFTSAFRTLNNTLDGAYSELRNLQGFYAINPLIAASINAEPTLRHLQHQYNKSQAALEKAEAQKQAARNAAREATAKSKAESDQIVPTSTEPQSKSQPNPRLASVARPEAAADVDGKVEARATTAHEATAAKEP